MSATMCPLCEQVGTIDTVRINATGEIVHLCEECDALWPSGARIQMDTLKNFRDYVREFGLKGLWTEVTILNVGV